MKNSIKKIALITTFFSLASCSLLSPVKTQSQAAYELNKMPTVTKMKAKPISILVVTPDETSAYNTAAMAYSTKPYEIAYYSQSRWANTPAQMLLPLITQTLQNTNHFQSVLTPPFGGQYDYLLTTQIIKIEQDFTHQPACFKLVVRVQLNRASINRVIATKSFNIYEPILKNDAYSGVIAGNLATEKFLKGVAEFVTKHT